MRLFSNFFLVLGAYSVLLCSCSNQARHENNENVQVSDTLKNTKDTALININEQIKKNPGDLSLFHRRAKYLFDRAEINGAIADMHRIIKLDSSQSEYFLTLAEILLVTGNGGGVKQALDKCVTLDPKNVQGHLKMAEFRMLTDDFKGCLKELDEALKIDKYNAKAYFIKGMAFKNIGDTAKAVSSFQTTVEQDPEYYHAYMQLGLIYAAVKNNFAIDYFKSAVKNNPKSIEAYYALGMFYQENNMPELALASYDAIIKIDASYKNAHFNKGFVYSEYLNDFSKALLNYNDAIKYAPDYVEAYYQRGFTYERMKNINQASLDYKQALKINPTYTLAARGLERVQG